MDKPTLVLASSNKGKLKEIAEILKDFNVVGYKQLGFDFDIEENGNSFYENALIKAKTVSEALCLPALSDDSGLCVTALNGAPGIYSARYAGDGSDKSNRAKLLFNMKGAADRSAKFVCCAVLCFPDGRVFSSTGETFGKILEEEQGEKGFGYDSVFFSDDLKKSFGLASEDEKNAVSHRYRALCKMQKILKDSL